MTRAELVLGGNTTLTFLAMSKNTNLDDPPANLNGVIPGSKSGTGQEGVE